MIPEDKPYDGAKDCEHCGRKPEDTSMVFKNERWCSDTCEKALIAKAAVT